MDKISSVSSESHSASESDASSVSVVSSESDTACKLDTVTASDNSGESYTSSDSDNFFEFLPNRTSSESEANYELDTSSESDAASNWNSTDMHWSNASDTSTEESDLDEISPNLQRLKILASKVQNEDGNFLLHQFVLDYSNPKNKGNEAYVNAVLMSMFDITVNNYNADGYTALQLAVLQNGAFMVKKLLTCLQNIDINFSCNIRGTPTALHLAIRCGHLEIVKELLQHGSDVNKKDGYSYTPLFEAESACNAEVVKLLLESGANVNKTGETVLIQAGMGGSDTDVRSRTPIFGDRSDIIKLLLKGGADVNAKDEYNCTSLHYAAKFNFYKGVRLLLQNRAEVNFFGSTPLHCAAMSCRAGIVKLLLDSGAEVNAKDFNGCTCRLKGKKPLL